MCGSDPQLSLTMWSRTTLKEAALSPSFGILKNTNAPPLSYCCLLCVCVCVLGEEGVDHHLTPLLAQHTAVLDLVLLRLRFPSRFARKLSIHLVTLFPKQFAGRLAFHVGLVRRR